MPKTFWLILYFILLLSLEFVFWGRLIAYFQDIFTQLIPILDCILGGIYGERFLNAEFPLDSPWPRSLRRRYYIGVYFYRLDFVNIIALVQSNFLKSSLKSQPIFLWTYKQLKQDCTRRKNRYILSELSLWYRGFPVNFV